MSDIDNSPTPQGDAQHLGFLIIYAARLLRATFERRISQAGLGITPGEARTLANIAEADGSRQSDIATKMGVEPMTLCAYLDRLQAMNLIERQQCGVDRRAKRIILTAEAAPLLAAIRAELRTITAQATQGIDPADAERLTGAMAIFNANLLTISAPPQAGKNDC